MFQHLAVVVLRVCFVMLLPMLIYLSVPARGAWCTTTFRVVRRKIGQLPHVYLSLRTPQRCPFPPPVAPPSNFLEI